MSDAETLIRREGRLGRITLNRPAALNALSLGMIEAIDGALAAWEHDPQIAAVLIDGAGPRGLCAGGDIRVMQENVRSGAAERPDRYLAIEYAMNARIAAFPKPYVAFMDGIVMGGGVGVSAHGSVRIVTERTRLAMPEVGIGFLPDVGGTWLLSRAPGELGTHAGLTGTILTAFDAIACGLADHHVPSERLDRLAASLRDCEDTASVARIVAEQASPPDRAGFAAAPDWIAACYRHDEAERIVAALNTHADPAAREAAARIEAVCPMSVVVTLRALRLARGLGSLSACLALEHHLAAGLIRRPDFVEGVRAALVDKDRTPSWRPGRLSEIDRTECDHLFAGFQS
jgi:enoyl-CoA hydratase